MLNKQTVQTIGIQAENMNKQRKLPKKMNGKARKIGHLIGLADVIETRKLVDFSYHLQIHDWGWIPFYLTKVYFFLDFFFFKYCRSISRDVMQSNFFFPRGQVLVFIKD